MRITLLGLLTLFLWAGCANSALRIEKRCIQQFTEEESQPFFEPVGYCKCAMPKLTEYCEGRGIDLESELKTKRFYELVLEHPALDVFVKECGRKNPTKHPDDTVGTG